MYKSNHTHQQKEESLSEYISWVDRMLHQIILKRDIDPKDVDQARLNRVLQGTWTKKSYCIKVITEENLSDTLNW